MPLSRELSQLAAVITVKDSNKHVGIGSTTPTAEFDVAGSVKATTFIGDGSNLTGIDTTVSESDVTAHQAALSITESQISDLGDYATVSYVNSEVAGIVSASPAALDTLNELAAALGDDANFSTTVTNQIAQKADISGAQFTGIVTATSFVGTNSGPVSFIGATETLTNKTLSSPIFQSGSNSPQFLEQRFVNANTVRFSQMYDGSNNGTYFTNGEYQKICTIIPNGDAQNYTFIARITATSASSYQVVYFSGALRSNTLPDLSFTTNYYQEHNGTQFIEPKLFTKETSTAGFIIAFKYINGSNLYGNITCDVDIIPRSSSQRDNITINTDQSSEQSSVDTGYTERDATLIYTNRSGTLEFGTQFRFEGSTEDGFETTVTATDPTADRTITFPDSSGTVALVGGNAISEVSDDTTPQLGGSLDINGNDITGTGNINVSGVVTATSFSGDGSSLTGVVSETLDVFVRSKDAGNIVGRSGNIALRPVAITVTSNTIDIVPRSGSDITVTV